MSVAHLNRLIAKKGRVYTEKELSSFYSSRVWKKCRLSVLERDDFLCQKCIKEHPVPAEVVHHIIPLKEDPTKALNDSNLISLCRECHEIEHNRVGADSDVRGEVSSKINVYSVIKNEEKT